MRMPRTVLAEVPTGERPAARASTKYMETFQLSRPALGGTDITTYANTAGNLDLYTIGTNDRIHRLRRGENADAPYQDTALNIEGRQLFLYPAVSANNDTPNIMTLGGNGQLKLAEYRDAVGTYYQVETKPADATQTIRQFKGVRGITGNIYINVMLDVPGSDVGLLANNFFKPGTSQWAGRVWAPILGPDMKQAQVKAIAMVENDPVQEAILAISKDNDVLFSENSDRTSVLRVLGFKKVIALSVVVDQNKKLNIFAIEKDTGKLLLKKEKKYQVNKIIQFDDWIYVDPSQTVKLTSIYASQCFNDLLQVFGIGDDGRLWRTAQATTRTDPTWSTLFPLGNEIPTDPDSRTTLFTVGRDRAGYAEAYTVSAAGELCRFWQSPTSQQWFEEDVALLRTDSEMVQVPTHALELVVLDEAGEPIPFATITITASFLVTLFVGGRSYRCSQLDRIVAVAGPNGKVVIQQKANALAAATLYIETPSTLSSSPLVVEPNLQLQDKLANLTVDEIKNAKDASGQYLLPAEYRTKDEYARSLQLITQAAMQIAGTNERRVAKVNYHFVSRGAMKGFSPRLDLTALEGMAFAIDLTSGFPMYQGWTTTEVAAWKASKLQAMRPEDPGFLGIDWGAIWNGIKNGARYVFEGLTKIIVEVVEGIGRVLFEIGGKVFEAVIEFAQQAFDFVEGVWNWLKVKLQQLFEWLGFLFNIGDIVRTAEAVEHSVGVLIDFTVAGVDHVKRAILSGIDTMKDDLKSTVDRFIADLNKQGNPTYQQFSDQQSMTDDESYQLEHNVFSDAYQQNGGRAAPRGQSTAGLMTSPRLTGSLDNLVQQMTDLVNNFQFGDGKEAFEEAIEFFTAIGDNPNSALQLLMSGVVKVMESVTLFALDAARGVIGLLMDLIREVIEAFRAALFEEWEIPIVSQLYKLFTGKTLSIRMVQIASYLVAIPSTLIYKFATGKAPFPDQAALDEFENYLTVDWLKSKLGIPTIRRVAFNAEAENAVAAVSLAFYAGGMFVRVFTDSLTGFLSATAAVPDQGSKLPTRIKDYVGTWTPTGKASAGLVSVGMRYITTLATTPWLIRSGVPQASCPAGSPGFVGMIWITQLIFGPTTNLFIMASPVVGKPRIYMIELSLTLWGVAQLIMIAWNYAASPVHDKLAQLALARQLTNVIPGQIGRCLFVPDIQEALYFVPAIIGEVLIVVGYLGSTGVAIAELVEVSKSNASSIASSGHAAHRLAASQLSPQP